MSISQPQLSVRLTCQARARNRRRDAGCGAGTARARAEVVKDVVALLKKQGRNEATVH